MNTDELVNVFDQLVMTISSSNDLRKCLHEVLEITGQGGNEALGSVDVGADLDSVVSQLKNTLEMKPPSSEIRLFWFGLFDELCGDKERAGYYFGGWTGEEQLHEGGTPKYFPECYLKSKLLEAVKGEAVRIGRKSPDMYPEFRVFDYAVMFGAAATLSRFATLALRVGLPTYVGFDSGDFARIAN